MSYNKSIKAMYGKNTSPEKLIQAVKKYPSIWSFSCPEYKIQKKREEAWDKVASDVIDGWNNLSRTERHHNQRFIIRRWNNIRFCYQKSLKRTADARLKGEPYSKRYMYADKLSFLKTQFEKNISIAGSESNASMDLKYETDEEHQEMEEEEYVTFVNTEHDLDNSNSKERDALDYEEVNESTKTEDEPDLKRPNDADIINKKARLRVLDAKNTSSERLIQTVKKYPSIWSISCPEYKIAKRRRDSWDKIASEMIDGWSNLSRTERHLSLRFIIKRWNNIRDYFQKSLKRTAVAKLMGEPYQKQYMYADELSFLKTELEKNISIAVRESNASEEDEEPQEMEEEEEYVTFVNTFEHDLDESNSKERDALKYEEVNVSTKPEDDPDLMFLKSLLPDMKKLADREKFEFKYAIMQAYMEILNKRK